MVLHRRRKMKNSADGVKLGSPREELDAFRNDPANRAEDGGSRHHGDHRRTLRPGRSCRRQTRRSVSGTTGCPAPTSASQKLCEEWAAKEKVEVTIDYIPSQGDKLLLTIAAEAQARSGHDIMALSTWLPADYAQEPRAGRRRHGRADQAERRRQPDRRVSRPGPTASGSRCRLPSAARSRARARAST